MKRTATAAIVIALALPAGADNAGMPSLLSRAMKPPATAQLYAYEFINRSEGGDRAGTVRGRIDPSRPEGDRVTILEATGPKLDAKKIDKRMERNADGDIWCDSLTGGADGPVVEKSAGVFAFTPRPRAEAKGEEKKLYKQLSAEIAVDEATATIRTFSARLLKPWSAMMVAKIEKVEMTGECALAPNGRAYRASMKTSMAGSAMGGAFASTSTQTITNLVPVN